LASLGHPCKFQRVSHLGFTTAATLLNGGEPNFARCLAISWAGTQYIHFRGLLPPNGILPGAKFPSRPSLVFSYIGSVTARHSSSGCQPNFAVLSRGCYLYSAGHPSCWASAHILVFDFCFLSTSQEIGWEEEHLRNNLLCVEWGVKP